MKEMNRVEFNYFRYFMAAVFTVLFVLAVCGMMRVHAEEVTEDAAADQNVAVVEQVPAAPADSDNDGIADQYEAQVEAQQNAAEEAQVKAQAEIERSKKIAEEAQAKAQAEIEQRKAEAENEQKRLAAEQKAKEDEIKRQKEEEAAKKAAEEAQKKFEESLTASGMSDADFNALCKIVQAEDGHDSVEGRIGIANVILNRVRNPRFPNSIMGVITAPGQFGPVSSGKFAAAIPTASTVEAVKQAVSGINTVGGALYFHRGSNFMGKTLVATAGAHGFFA